jgi:hypothetical protein
MESGQEAPARRSPGGWERHVQTVMLTLMLGVLGYIGSQYTAQDTRISVAEVRMGVGERNASALAARMTRFEDQRDREMAEIRSYLQRIEDKLDRKADKP